MHILCSSLLQLNTFFYKIYRISVAVPVNLLELQQIFNIYLHIFKVLNSKKQFVSNFLKMLRIPFISKGYFETSSQGFLLNVFLKKREVYHITLFPIWNFNYILMGLLRPRRLMPLGTHYGWCDQPNSTSIKPAWLTPLFFLLYLALL